jgi:hypothetical protein
MFTFAFTTFSLALKSLFGFANQKSEDSDSDETIISRSTTDMPSRNEPEVSDIMKDFYEESSPEEWNSMSTSGKRKRLDGDIEEYMAEKRKKELDKIRD